MNYRSFQNSSIFHSSFSSPFHFSLFILRFFTFHSSFFILLTFSFFIFHSSFSSIAAPQPSFNYYGQITTELGLPIIPDEQATLIVRSGDTVISRSPIQRSGVAGCNYIAEIPLDSDSTPYRDYALKSGAAVTFALADAKNRESALYPVGAIPPVGRSGDAKRLDLSAGRDTIGDGLTDAFRDHIVAASQGRFTGLSEVLPEDDFDGDGMSNRDEFRSGTDATWAADVLQVAGFRPEEGRLAFRFAAVEGIAYRVYGAGEVDADGRFVWSPVQWSLTPDGALDSAPFTGRGQAATLYLPIDHRVKFFKLIVD